MADCREYKGKKSEQQHGKKWGRRREGHCFQPHSTSAKVLSLAESKSKAEEPVEGKNSFI